MEEIFQTSIFVKIDFLQCAVVAHHKVQNAL